MKHSPLEAHPAPEVLGVCAAAKHIWQHRIIHGIAHKVAFQSTEKSHLCLLTTHIWKKQIPVSCHVLEGGNRSSLRKGPMLRQVLWVDGQSPRVGYVGAGSSTWRTRDALKTKQVLEGPEQTTGARQVLEFTFLGGASFKDKESKHLCLLALEDSFLVTRSQPCKGLFLLNP